MAVRRRRFWIAGALALLAGVLVIALAIGERPIPSQRLPDGTVISIPKVSYGKVNVYNPGTLWQVIAAKILPARLQKRFGLWDRSVAITNATDTIVLFVQLYRSKRTLFDSPDMMQDYGGIGGIWGDVQDEAGKALPLGKIFTTVVQSNLIVEVFQVPLGSHTATELRLNVWRYDWKSGSGRRTDTRFAVLNPAASSTATRTVQPEAGAK